MKYRFRVLSLLAVTLSLVINGSAGGVELSGNLSLERSWYQNKPIHAGQVHDDISVAAEPELYHEFTNGSSVILVPFVRYDSQDNERSHYDVREFNALILGDTWEARIGIGKVFWGVTEFIHLVDIINQTDIVESFDQEEKLGQPMVSLSIPSDIGVFDFFVLPLFRERTFPGRGGRLRSSLVVDTNNPEYEDAQKERHIDFAIRYSHTVGDVDFGFYHFEGTSRDPQLKLMFDRNTGPRLIPYYEQIRQNGLDLQMISGEWVWKLEAITRASAKEEYTAGALGFEYTSVGIFDTQSDLGFLTEYAYDDRGSESSNLFNNELMLGMRLVVNDLSSTEVLVGYIQDMETSSRMIRVEASSRIGDNFKAILEATFFTNTPIDDLAYSFRDDDFIKLELAWYY